MSRSKLEPWAVEKAVHLVAEYIRTPYVPALPLTDKERQLAEAIAAALMEERERCARIAEAVYSGDEGTNSYLYDEGPKIAEAIRKESVK